MKVLFLDLFEPGQLDERMTFDQLMSVSDPKRITRASTVRVPPLKFDAYKDQEAYYFNVKSSPSTTGLRHKGYIQVFKPKNPNTPLEHCECEVGCSCPDYRYRFAFANKQRGSGKVGPSSISQCANRAPRVTNPQGKPGLCKHLCSVRDWIYGHYRSFSSDQDYDSTTSRLNRLVKQSSKLWANYPGEMEKAQARDQKIKQSIERAAYLRANPSAVPGIGPGIDNSSPSARADISPSLAKSIGAKAAGLSPSAAGSEKAQQAAGDETVAAWRAKRSEESFVVTNMTNMLKDVNLLIEEQAGIELLKTNKKSPVGDDESEELKLLRQVRDIVRHLAGDDLPPELANQETTSVEPGIPVDAVEAGDQN